MVEFGECRAKKRKENERDRDGKGLERWGGARETGEGPELGGEARELGEGLERGGKGWRLKPREGGRQTWSHKEKGRGGTGEERGKMRRKKKEEGKRTERA